MLKLSLAVFFSAAAFLPLAAAQAQEQSGAAPVSDVSQLQEYEDFVIQPLGFSIDHLEDMVVIGPNAKEVGAVEEILVDGKGRVVAISVDIGGFLGVVEHEVVLSLDQVGVQADREKLTVSMTREQLKQLPEWKND